MEENRQPVTIVKTDTNKSIAHKKLYQYENCQLIALAYCPRALEILMDLAEISDHEPTRKNAATELLNRGLGPPKPIEVGTGEDKSTEFDFTNMSLETMESLLLILKDAKENEIEEAVIEAENE